LNALLGRRGDAPAQRTRIEVGAVAQADDDEVATGNAQQFGAVAGPGAAMADPGLILPRREHQAHAVFERGAVIELARPGHRAAQRFATDGATLEVARPTQQIANGGEHRSVADLLPVAEVPLPAAFVPRIAERAPRHQLGAVVVHMGARHAERREDAFGRELCPRRAADAGYHLGQQQVVAV
jgi:hypothetical protein